VTESTAQLVVEVYVRDLERSLGFYRALGFGLERRTGGFAVLSWAGHVLFLDEQPQFPDLAGRERANVRVMVPDVDAVWRRAQSIGATVSAPIADRPYGLRDFTVRDPDGFGLRFASLLTTGRTDHADDSVSQL
jgi:catechol 2,3-dioxygenase-like lactoylglutathione lyase family enzyme